MAVSRTEFADLTIEEIQEKLDEAREELFNLRFQHATGQLDNYRALRNVRRDVARISTFLRERELAEAEES